MVTDDQVREARLLTMDALDLTEDEVAYISKEFIEELLRDATETDDIAVDEFGDHLDASAEDVACRPGTYGNRLVFERTRVLYSQGDPGPSFMCGSRYRKIWGNQTGDTFTPVRPCPNGHYGYHLCRPGFAAANDE